MSLKQAHRVGGLHMANHCYLGDYLFVPATVQHPLQTPQKENPCSKAFTVQMEVKKNESNKQFWHNCAHKPPNSLWLRDVSTSDYFPQGISRMHYQCPPCYILLLNNILVLLCMLRTCDVHVRFYVYLESTPNFP